MPQSNPSRLKLSEAKLSVARTLTGVLFVAALVAVPGCRSNGVQASGAGSGGDISAAPTFNAVYQSRNPRKCAKVTSPPSAAQAAALVQCSTESDSTGSATPMITLVTGVEVEVGSPRAFLPGQDDQSDIDPSAKVYPIRGQGTMWQCGPASDSAAGQNCYSYPPTHPSPGICYKTTFGDWNCLMPTGGPQQLQHQKGPTTY